MDTVEKRLGPPKIAIPEEISELLESTYATGREFKIASPDNEDARQFISLAKLYGKRVDRSVRVYWSKDKTYFTFLMTDKRSYRKSSAERER